MLPPLHIALIELKRFVRSKGELAFSLALPVVLFAVMYGAFGGDSSFHAVARIVDLDDATHSRALIAGLDAMDEISVELYTLADADAALDRAAILMAVVIPSGFSAAIDGGEPTTIGLKQRGSGAVSDQIVASVVLGAAQRMGGEGRVRRVVEDALSGSGAPQASIDAAVERQLEQARTNPPIGIVERRIGVSSPDPLHRMVPGMLVMFLIFALTPGAQTLVEERRIGVLERLMTTRISATQLFAGKFLAGAVRGTLQAAILLALAFAVFRLGGALDFAALAALGALIAATVSALGLLIGSVARTRDQAAWAAAFLTMLMTIFGGAFFEVSGGAMDALSRLTLTRYAIDAMQAILASGESLAQQAPEAAVIAGVGVVALVAARLLFRVAGGGR